MDELNVNFVITVTQRLRENSFWLGISAIGAYFVSISILASLGIFSGSAVEAESAPSMIEPVEDPVAVLIPEIGVESPILNPESTDITVLDASLLSGAVRYPDSARLGEDANMLLFAHSTTYRVVRNPAYKAFNRLGQLSEGSFIYVRSLTREHLYRVRDVKLVSADTALIEFKTGERIITLTTCNTFGAKEERHVVTAEFVRSYPLIISESIN